LFLYRQVSSVSSILGDTADAALVYFLFGCCLLWGFAKPWLYFLFGCCLLWGLTELPTAHCSLNYIRMHMGKRSWISCSQMLSSENGNCFFLYFSISGRSCTGYHSFYDVKFISIPNNKGRSVSIVWFGLVRHENYPLSWHKITHHATRKLYVLSFFSRGLVRFVCRALSGISSLPVQPI
jgi:hypothetical protein